MNEESITVREAYLAMFSLLDELYTRYQVTELGAVLASMSLLSDGSTADPAKWNDWLEAVKRAKAGGVDAALKVT